MITQEEVRAYIEMLVEMVWPLVVVGWAILFLLLLLVLYKMRKLRQRLAQIGVNRPVVPTKELVAIWKKRIRNYEPGSHKYEAYKKRIAEFESGHRHRK